MTVLLDADVLVALTVTDHVHHDLAEDWFARRSELSTTYRPQTTSREARRHH